MPSCRVKTDALSSTKAFVKCSYMESFPRPVDVVYYFNSQEPSTKDVRT